MDNLSKENRKKNMSHIRSKGNITTERRLRSSFAGAGISGYKMNLDSLPGKPDFAFPQYKVAVFVDGCFWHGCPNCYIRPRSSIRYWDEKLKRNKNRDDKVNHELKEAGWVFVRIWEHTLKQPQIARMLVIAAINKQKKK
jgi:DNA mismatch endonuclease, patch repair protein